jgi:hypothetical protein
MLDTRRRNLMVTIATLEDHLWSVVKNAVPLRCKTHSSSRSWCTASLSGSSI